MEVWLIVPLVFIGLLLLILFYVNYGRWRIDSHMLAKNFKSKLFLEKSWHQYAFIPNKFQKKCSTDTSAVYTQKLNGNISVKNTCRDKNGKLITVTGEAYLYTPSKLKVSFVPKILTNVDKFLQIFGDINLFTGDYYVLSTDNINYAMIGTANLDYLWILVIDPNYFNIEKNKSQYKALVAMAADYHYPVTDLLISS